MMRLHGFVVRCCCLVQTHDTLCVCLAACVDVGLTVSERYSVDVRHHHHLRQTTSPVDGSTTVGYVAHLMGAAAGLAAGFLVLRPTTPAYRHRRSVWRPRRTFQDI